MVYRIPPDLAGFSGRRAAVAGRQPLPSGGVCTHGHDLGSSAAESYRAFAGGSFLMELL